MRVRQLGFSLVELSIVLVILGLLVGGVLSGQALINAAELRAVSTEFSLYAAAANRFQEKYFASPGDMPNATAVWGRLNTSGTCISNSGIATAGTPGVCDGNGDKSVLWDNTGAVSTSREMHQFWRHLALAGLIEGNYTGLAGPLSNSADTVPGTNSPVSKLTKAGWGAAQTICGAGTQCFTNVYPVTAYPAYFMIGRRPTAGGNLPTSPAMKNADAWNLDTKLDDGKPATGDVISLWVNSNGCTTATSSADATGNYNLQVTASWSDCALIFLNAF